jgi:HK97 gp10 family phage protein
MTIRVKGKRISKSREVLGKYDKQLKQIIAVGGQMVMNEAKQSIHSHGSSGRTYEKYNPRRTHTASSAGNPPNTDTGYLANNIYLEIDTDGLGADVESRAEYSEFLEFGTSKMLPRPFLQPALEANRRKIIQMFARLKSRGV